MKYVKRFIIILLISILSVGAIFISYTGIDNGAIVYADTNTWSNCNTIDMQSKAFLAYCKSRDLTLEGSLADGLTSYTTSTYQKLLNSIGVDMNTIQSDIKYASDSNTGLQFLLTSNGATVFNRLFSQFLQDNEISVGDTVNKELYNGYISDGSLYTIINSSSLLNGHGASGNQIKQVGDYYAYSHQDILNMLPTAGTVTQVINLPDGNNYNATFQRASYDGNWISPGVQYQYYTYYYYNAYGRLVNGYCGLIYNLYDNKAYFGVVNILKQNNNYTNQIYTLQQLIFEEDEENAPQQTIITAISVGINNNTYEGNTYTTINNEGDVNNYDTETEPSPGDGGGSGGGGDTPTPPSGNVDDWGVELPNLDIPWYLYGKEDKFPWNIPFNIMLTLSLLKAEPEAPHFEGTMDFKFTTYDYSIDLSEFDSVAEVMRKLEVIAFLIGLMILTKRLIDW